MSISMRVLPRFPARITATDGLTVVRDGTDVVVKQDFGSLIRIPSVDDPDKVFFIAWNSDEDLYSIMSFTDTFAAVIDTTGLMSEAVYDPQGIEADAFDRANHTGTQAIASVSGLQAALDAKPNLAGANRFTGVQQLSKGADIASAASLTLGSDGNYFHVTGATGITGISTQPAGTIIALEFDGALTITHNATSLILPNGANITTNAGYTAVFVSEGSGNWRMLSSPAATTTAPGGVELLTSAEFRTGTDSVRALTASAARAEMIALGTPVASTSGTSIDFTGIPAWAKCIKVMFDGVSLSGSASILVQLGTASGPETSGYVATSASTPNGVVPSTLGSSAGFPIFVAGASQGCSGSLILMLMSTNKWVCQSVLSRSEVSVVITTAGTKSLSGTLDRIRITSTGADTFDAGNINISWE